MENLTLIKAQIIPNRKERERFARHKKIIIIKKVENEVDHENDQRRRRKKEMKLKTSMTQ